jgi:hypothetical protein
MPEGSTEPSDHPICETASLFEQVDRDRLRIIHDLSRGWRISICWRQPGSDLDAGAGLASCQPEGVTETAPTKECLFASRVEATWKKFLKSAILLGSCSRYH